MRNKNKTISQSSSIREAFEESENPLTSLFGEDFYKKDFSSSKINDNFLFSSPNETNLIELSQNKIKSTSSSSAAVISSSSKSSSSSSSSSITTTTITTTTSTKHSTSKSFSSNSTKRAASSSGKSSTSSSINPSSFHPSSNVLPSSAVKFSQIQSQLPTLSQSQSQSQTQEVVNKRRKIPSSFLDDINDDEFPSSFSSPPHTSISSQNSKKKLKSKTSSDNFSSTAVSQQVSSHSLTQLDRPAHWQTSSLPIKRKNKVSSLSSSKKSNLITTTSSSFATLTSSLTPSVPVTSNLSSSSIKNLSLNFQPKWLHTTSSLALSTSISSSPTSSLNKEDNERILREHKERVNELNNLNNNIEEYSNDISYDENKQTISENIIKSSSLELSDRNTTSSSHSKRISKVKLGSFKWRLSKIIRENNSLDNYFISKESLSSSGNTATGSISSSILSSSISFQDPRLKSFWSVELEVYNEVIINQILSNQFLILHVNILKRFRKNSNGENELLILENEENVKEIGENIDTNEVNSHENEENLNENQTNKEFSSLLIFKYKNIENIQKILKNYQNKILTPNSSTITPTFTSSSSPPSPLDLKIRLYDPMEFEQSEKNFPSLLKQFNNLHFKSILLATSYYEII